MLKEEKIVKFWEKSLNCKGPYTIYFTIFF
jgi:hypothetical protein